MKLTGFQIGSIRKRVEGLRIGTVRFLPRGVFKKDYARLDYFDVWLPSLAPSRNLLKWAKSKEWNPQTRKEFFLRYEREIKSNTDAKQTIKLLAEMSKRTALSIGCYCDDEKHCHRSVLLRLIRKAAEEN